MVSLTAKKIKKLRTDRGMTQKQLAQAIGCAQTSVSEWEREKSVPNEEHLAAMLELFDLVTASQTKEEAPTPEPRTEEREPWLWAAYVAVFGIFIYYILTVTGKI